MLITRKCPMCGRIVDMEIRGTQEEEYNAYALHGGIIQEVLVSFDNFGREFVMTGYCPECQQRLFGTRLEDKTVYSYHNLSEEV